MLILLSPAKRLNFNPINSKIKTTLPQALPETKKLIKVLKEYSAEQLATLMSLSSSLAQLNYQRFQDFNSEVFNEINAKAAIYAFEGDVYRYLAVHTFSNQQLADLQHKLLILSGLYGYLRPLDLIQPYRLEMGTVLAVADFKNLYQFWQNKIAEGINQHMKEQGHSIIINLASEEYFKAVDKKQLTVPIKTIAFKERRGDRYHTIGIHAKRARGLMTRFILVNQINSCEALKDFSEENYKFSNDLSDEETMYFLR